MQLSPLLILPETLQLIQRMDLQKLSVVLEIAMGTVLMMQTTHLEIVMGTELMI